jgi:peroxiredoxin
VTGAERLQNGRWLLAVVAIAALGYVLLHGTNAQGPGARGLPAGTPLPPFAAPLIGDMSCDDRAAACDANVATKAGQGRAGSRPACAVRGPRILNICELTERGPVVLAFLATRGGDCADTLDVLRRVAARHSGVAVAAVGIRGDLATLRAVAQAHRWRFPVGWDRDGILANLYGVAVCPHVTVARWHGRAQATLVGAAVGERALDRAVAAAVAVSRRAGWRPR